MSYPYGKAPAAAARIALLALFILPTWACNVFETKEEVAKEARVVISGTAPGPLELITSTRFERRFDDGGEARITLLVADTVQIDLASPHDQIYPVKPALGFFVRLANHDTVAAALVSMQVYFDGELSYDQRNVGLTDSSIEFSFIFSNINTVF